MINVKPRPRARQLAGLGFTPANVPGALAWYLGDNGVYTDDAGTVQATANGAAIHVWKDNLNHYDTLYRTTPATWAKSYRNAKSALSFAGNGIETDSPISVSQIKFIWGVVSPNSNGNMDILSADSTSGEAFIVSVQGGNFHFRYYNGADHYADSGVAAVAGQWYRIAGIIDGPSSRRCVVNNLYTGSDASAADSQLNTQSLVIGAYNASSTSFNGYVLDVLFGQSVPSTSTLQKLDTYAKVRYGF